MRRGTLAGRVTLAAVAAALALTLAEAGLRLWTWRLGIGRADALELLRLSGRAPAEIHTDSLFGLIQPALHPDIVYELRPRTHGTFRGQPYRANAFGMRGGETRREKAPGVFRIAGLGDSHMFGWGVGEGETYLELLESELGASGATTVETLNFACPGYNTAIEAAVYEHKAREFDPDLVLVHYVGNDDKWPHFLQPPRRLEPSDWLLADLVRAALSPADLDGELELLPHDRSRAEARLRQRTEARYRYMVGDDGYRRAMRRLAARTAEDGVPVAVLMLGEREIVVEAAERHGFAWIDAAPHFARWLERRGLAATRENWVATFKIRGDGHPTAAAHRAYAETLAAELVARGLAPGGGRRRGRSAP